MRHPVKAKPFLELIAYRFLELITTNVFRTYNTPSFQNSKYQAFREITTNSGFKTQITQHFQNLQESEFLEFRISSILRIKNTHYFQKQKNPEFKNLFAESITKHHVFAQKSSLSFIINAKSTNTKQLKIIRPKIAP